MSEKNEYITKQELLNGEPGIHIVTEDITGYKKVVCKCEAKGFFKSFFETFTHYQIAKLKIPEGAKIVNPYGNIQVRKLRSNKAIVDELNEKPDGENFIQKFVYDCECYSMRETDFKYKQGETCIPEFGFDKTLSTPCASGIHFFLKKSDAEDFFL